jgi:hypothetical protein
MRMEQGYEDGTRLRGWNKIMRIEDTESPFSRKKIEGTSSCFHHMTQAAPKDSIHLISIASKAYVHPSAMRVRIEATIIWLVLCNSSSSVLVCIQKTISILKSMYIKDNDVRLIQIKMSRQKPVNLKRLEKVLVSPIHIDPEIFYRIVKQR